MPTVLVTGANRGLGLEFARQYASAGWAVIAACRQPARAKELRTLASAFNKLVKIEEVDVASDASVALLKRRLARAKIDILINNAGVYGPKAQSLAKMDFAGWAKTLAINTLGPFRVAQALEKQIAAGDRKVIAIITSAMGSITENGSGNYYAYRSSKAAVNMVAKGLSIDLRPKGIIVVTLHPGWVQTDMGGPNAALTPTESIAKLRQVLERVKPADSGTFIGYDGRSIPW
jgi:NAD(P)-dependent dehydrogenase (short-subunit alcohol dehydrogenase family)